MCTVNSEEKRGLVIGMIPFTSMEEMEQNKAAMDDAIRAIPN